MHVIKKPPHRPPFFPAHILQAFHGLSPWNSCQVCSSARYSHALCEHKAKSGTSHFTVIRHGSNFNWSLLLYCTQFILLLIPSTFIKFSIIPDLSRKDTLTGLCLHWGRWTISVSVLSQCQNFSAFIPPLISTLVLVGQAGAALDSWLPPSPASATPPGWMPWGADKPLRIHEQTPPQSSATDKIHGCCS